MRKIRITESQWKRILESELGYPLSTKNAADEPDNFAGYEVPVDNTDPDAPDDVTTTDNISRKKMRPAQFGIRTARVAGGYRLEEGRELDNMQNSGFGKKADAQISQAATNNGGKMVKNLNAEIQSDTRGSRNNTNQVRASRLRDQKKNDPATFAKNGGDATLKALERQTKVNSDKNKATESETAQLPTATTSGSKKGKSDKPTIYYFK